MASKREWYTTQITSILVELVEHFEQIVDTDELRFFEILSS